MVLKPDQYEEWNRFVDASPQGDCFCYSWWLDAVTKSHFSIYAAIEKDEIAAGMPLAYDARGKINEPPLTRTLGVLFKAQNNLSEYRQKSNQRKWLNELLRHISIDDFVQTCAHHNFQDWLPYKWKGLNQTTRYTYLINNEESSIDGMWKNLNSGRKHSINQALKNKIRVEVSDDLKQMYQVITLSYIRQGLKFKIPFQTIKVLDDAIKKNGNRLILKAIDDLNRVNAVLYSVSNKKSAYFLLSGGDPELRNMGGHALVFWETIKYYHNKVGYCNFGGSVIQPIEEHLRGYGGVLTPYYHLYNDQLLHHTEIRYHLSELSHHLISLFRAVRFRFFWN